MTRHGSFGGLLRTYRQPGAAVRGLWAGARGYQHLAYLVGAGLILVGLAHAAIWALAGGSASGAVSWRKPTTFGISPSIASG